jgi:hypothetical protein
MLSVTGWPATLKTRELVGKDPGAAFAGSPGFQGRMAKPPAPIQHPIEITMVFDVAGESHKGEQYELSAHH